MTRERSEVWWAATGSRLTVMADCKGKGYLEHWRSLGQSAFRLRANDRKLIYYLFVYLSVVNLLEFKIAKWCVCREGN